MRLPEEPDLPPQIYIVPMIDVIFALLTFFIMSTLFLTRSQGLPVNLPSAATAEAQKSTQATVTIDQGGKLALNRKPIQLNSLENQVQGIKGKNRQILVIIDADRRVSHGQVITVMDRLRSIPGVRLAIGTQPP
ncbi:biopolymer transporter ExbD [Phormidesmis priestleyi ULC007]|uniref:Biopolymer transporter ExbD n=1 Tax=Phormidesmis priestleyi ULC007 TaxID=1920490 RepID=A0A2T1DMF3_9CYAN|nr:biopolymer transporter ExbD [Phormidesmis priestleyi]PSB21641.1 biopolymer transporter ExbD [Phormidesmis priestleyi ULC007]PZO54682.1 MAG: biopolymer transporter ExbD [Phormidesmis priestleyi]